ncbi:TolC family protein [Hyphomonas johnsonii]|uniref:Outer membrane efflux protein n=1 Tax=Hyphomonas johnsonii MHS-2 TaxID=1280950 RepID=A0A059FSE9_9PROT|nr:TolC family protein [Hyphomonas johnsonii]KCZ93517.1 outer membrane efflux protein [Hyphomonas johnsonii MHS-2]
MSKFRQGALCILIATAFAGGAIAAPCSGPQADAQAITPGTPLTLDIVLEQVRGASPDVRRAALESQARKADSVQAGRGFNPSIGLEVENFSGSGPLAGFDQSETTFSIEQTFQLGGKRSKRQQAAQANATLGAAECAVILRETELEAALLLYDLLAASQVAGLAEQAADLADTLLETVSKRVEAGAAAPPEQSRAHADAAALRAAVYQARAAVEQKRYDLAALWGSSEPRFALPDIDRTALSEPRAGGRREETHPQIAMAAASESARRAERDVARASLMPDLTVSAGIRQFEESGENAFLVGVRVPVPLFDQNRDAARAAGYRVDAERLNRLAVEAKLLASQRAAVAQVRAARERLTLLEDAALPAARSAYDASVQGYAAGKFDLTTTLDARKGLIEASMAVIAANRDLNAESLRLRSIIGAAPFDGDFQ